jgi:hypothetical protein
VAGSVITTSGSRILGARHEEGGRDRRVRTPGALQIEERLAGVRAAVLERAGPDRGRGMGCPGRYIGVRDRTFDSGGQVGGFRAWVRSDAAMRRERPDKGGRPCLE